MILYVTKETFERLKLKMPEEMLSPDIACLTRDVLDRESGDEFVEWGGKLFYFTRRKCLQVTHFSSKLTVFLVDIKLANLEYVGQMLALHLLDVYKGDAQMQALLERYFDDHRLLVFSRLKNQSIIATMNHTQRDFLFDGYRLYDYIRDGVLHSRQLSREFNEDWLVSKKVNGKKEYFCAKDLFRQQLLARYQGK